MQKVTGGTVTTPDPSTDSGAGVSYSIGLPLPPPLTSPLRGGDSEGLWATGHGYSPHAS